MYKSFEVSNFRCFDNLKIEDLGRVNLIGGLNNVGKTTLLEALFLHHEVLHDADVIPRIDSYRGLRHSQSEELSSGNVPWKYLFNKLEIPQTIELSAHDSEFGCLGLRLEIVRDYEELSESHPSLSRLSVPFQVLKIEQYEEGRDPRTIKYYLGRWSAGEQWSVFPRPVEVAYGPAVFLSSRQSITTADDANRFSTLNIIGESTILVESLKAIEPRLKSLFLTVSNTGPMIYGTVESSKAIPLPMMGDGVTRLASLVLAISSAPYSIVLIDEIENGFHYSVLPKVWQVIGEAARQFNVQVFATTHSFECIQAAHESFSQTSDYDLRFHRLTRVKGQIKASTFNQETLGIAVTSGWEVR